MLTLATEVNGIDLHTAHAICKSGSDFDTLEGSIGRAVTTYVTANPTAVLIDLSLSGGGAGNTFMATLLVAPVGGSPTEERLVNQVFHWFTAPDRLTLQTKLNDFFTALAGGNALWAWDIACAGDGAVWVAVLLTWQPGE